MTLVPHGGIHTHMSSGGGVHVAALGGVWMIAVLGFAVLGLLPDGLARSSQLPAGWTTLAFACQWRGRCVRIRIDQEATRSRRSGRRASR